MEAYGRVRGPMSSGAFPVGVGSCASSPSSPQSTAKAARRVTKRSPPIWRKTPSSPFPPAPAARTARSWAKDAAPQRGYVHSDGPRGGVLHPYRQGPSDHARGSLRNSQAGRRKRPDARNSEYRRSGQDARHLQLLRLRLPSLRTAEMFKNVDMVRSNYVSEVDPKNASPAGSA